MGVNPKIEENPPNHPFAHRVWTIIFTIHFGGKMPLFLGWHLFGWIIDILFEKVFDVFRFCFLSQKFLSSLSTWSVNGFIGFFNG